jgi:hypothetical protein
MYGCGLVVHEIVNVDGIVLEPVTPCGPEAPVSRGGQLGPSGPTGPATPLLAPWPRRARIHRRGRMAATEAGGAAESSTWPA